MSRDYGKSFYTGGMLEAENFGKIELSDIDVNKPKNREFVELYRNIDPKRIPLKATLDLARTNQPIDREADPSKPQKPFAKDLHAKICDSLGLKNENLRFYTAVGSPADYYKGVDAFFDLIVDGRVYTVTMDITMNPDKFDGWKADVIIVMPREGLDRHQDKDAYFEKISEVSENIIRRFKYITHNKVS